MSIASFISHANEPMDSNGDVRTSSPSSPQSSVTEWYKARLHPPKIQLAHWTKRCKVGSWKDVFCFFGFFWSESNCFFFLGKYIVLDFSDARFGDVAFMFDVVVMYFFCDTKNSFFPFFSDFQVAIPLNDHPLFFSALAPWPLAQRLPKRFPQCWDWAKFNLANTLQLMEARAAAWGAQDSKVGGSHYQLLLMEGRNPVDSPVEVGSWNPIICWVSYIQGG